MEIAQLVEATLNSKKLFDLAHCNAVIDKITASCDSDDDFVVFGKTLYGKHGWGVAAKLFIQVKQLEEKQAPPEILDLFKQGKDEEALVRFRQYADVQKILKRVRQIKEKISELEI
jgi:hypothetical protein